MTTEFEKFVQLYNSPNGLPHAPYGPLPDNFKSDDNMKLYVKDCLKGYDNRNVLCRDGDFAKLTSLSNNVGWGKNISQEAIFETREVPKNIAVTVSENVDGHGDIFESLSMVRHLERSGYKPALVLPRDKVTYEKTMAAMDLIGCSKTLIFDYHKAIEGEDFDLVIHPSIFRKFLCYGLPSKVSIFMEEPGASNSYTLNTVWNSREWGGFSFRIPTNFDPEIGTYGVTPPLFYQEKSEQKTSVVDKLRSSASGRELVLCYPGSNGFSDTSFVVKNFANHLDQLGIKADIIVPGNFEPVDVKLCNSRLSYPGFMHPNDLHELIKHLSRTVPSLSAGTMSFTDLIGAGVPTFYKTETWKKGNKFFLEGRIKDVGLDVKELKWGDGTFYSGEVSGFDFRNDTKVRELCEILKGDVEAASDKMVPSLVALYNLGISVQRDGIPKSKLNQEQLKSLIESKLI